MKKRLSILMAVLTLSVTIVPSFSLQAMAAEVLPFEKALNYAYAENWVFDGAYYENEVDAFLVPPTVDTKSPSNSAMTEEYKKRIKYAMNQQQAIYAKTARIYSPYYRQASSNIYSMDDLSDRQQTLSNAYQDVSAAFKYYLKYKNNGRPLILAGFSQGADMCYRLLEEYYGGDSPESAALRNNLVAVYAIGWSMTEEMLEKYPQIVPASGETDTGVVVSFDCEDGNIKDSIVIPKGKKAISINPLNWRTDSEMADKSLNMGSIKQDSKTGAVTDVEYGKYGAYIDPKRGSLIVTGIDVENFPPRMAIFKEGNLHIYDNFLFFVNLQTNVQTRTDAFLATAGAHR